MNELKYFADPLTDTGQSIVFQLYGDDGTQTGSDIAATELPNAIYVADMPAVAAGVYAVRVLQGTSLQAQSQIAWDGSKEINFALVHTGASLKAHANRDLTVLLDNNQITASLSNGQS